MAEFMRFGCFTFGGGWSIVAQMQQLYVDKKKAITSQELLDITSVARSLPGTMIGNVAMLYGYQVGGFFGGIVSLFGMCFPPLLVLIAISFGYSTLRDNYWVCAALDGMKASVVPIIAFAAIGLSKGSVSHKPFWLVVALCFALYLFFEVSAVVIVLIGIVSGFTLGEYCLRKEAKAHDPS